jgi:predicted nucleic acid-binding protein
LSVNAVTKAFGLSGIGCGLVFTREVPDRIYPPSMKVVMDANGVDPIADNPGAYEALRAAVDNKQVEILYTHVTIDELCEIPDVDRRSKLILVLADLGTVVPTGAAALDFSRVGFCRLSSDADDPDFEAWRSGNVRHTRDALIAATGAFEKATIVTYDERLTKRAKERGIDVLTTKDLLTNFGFTI